MSGVPSGRDAEKFPVYELKITSRQKTGLGDPLIVTVVVLELVSWRAQYVGPRYAISRDRLESI